MPCQGNNRPNYRGVRNEFSEMVGELGIVWVREGIEFEEMCKYVYKVKVSV